MLIEEQILVMIDKERFSILSSARVFEERDVLH